MRFGGLGGLGGFIFTVSIMKRIAQKLRRSILRHLGLVTFRFHYWRIMKPLIRMIWGFSDVSMTPRTNIIYLRRHQERHFEKHNKIQTIFEISFVGNLKCSEIKNHENVGKDGRRKLPTIRLISS